MQALIAASAAAGGGAAATGAAAAGVTGSTLLLQAAGPIVGGISSLQQAKGLKEGAEINSYIGRTRALQTDAAARSGLDSELATMRATFAANQQRPGVGTFEIMRELRKVRGQERAVEFSNLMQEAADYRMAGKNAMAKGTGALLTGFANAGPSLFDFYNYRRKSGG